MRRLIAGYQRLGDEVEMIDVPRERLAEIRARTLLVTGDRDPEFPLHRAVEMVQAIPDAALWVDPGQEHMAVWSDWGGSAEAASIFPAAATSFLGTEPL